MTPRKKAKRAPAKRKRGKEGGMQPITVKIEAQVAEINRLIEEMAQQEEMQPADLLELQFQMNLLSQLLETSTNFMAVMHETMKGLIRNMK